MTTAKKDIVFDGPDIGTLTQIASKLGLELQANSDIRLAQQLYERGAKIPGTEDWHEPLESFYILQIMNALVAKKDGFLIPPELIVYANDRGFTKIPETTFPTVAKRQTLSIFRQLATLVGALNAQIEADKNKI